MMDDDDVELVTLGAHKLLRTFCCTRSVGGLFHTVNRDVDVDVDDDDDVCKQGW